jgi:hypothetical protein
MLAGNAMTQMPAAIATPEEAKVVTLHAEGAQIYEWRPRNENLHDHLFESMNWIGLERELTHAGCFLLPPRVSGLF